MDMAIKRANGLAWKIDFEAALALGVKRMVQMKAADEELKRKAAQQLAERWQDYDAEVRAGLPEVLRPVMTPLRDETSEPPYNPEEQVLLDLEPLGLGPILVHVQMVSPGIWQVHQYLVMGIYETNQGSTKRYGFGDGDECWAVEPSFETDMTLALGMAHLRFNRKLELEATARRYRSEEIEYVEDNQELETVAEKALVASVRAIVRHEMSNPPQE